MYPRNFGSYKIVRTYVRLPLHVTGGESLHFKHPARFGGKRARIKITEANFFGRKTWKFDSGGEKMRNASGHQGENELQWKEVNRNTYISSVKRVTGRFVEFLSLLSCKTTANVERSVLHVQSWYFCGWLDKLLLLVVLIVSWTWHDLTYIYIFFWVNYKY